MVHLGVVVALRGRMMTLEGFEPLTSGVVVSRIALLQTDKIKQKQICEQEAVKDNANIFLAACT